jgi:hypothetical protein
VFEQFPELRRDLRVNLAVGSILVQHDNAETACRGSGYLWAFLASEDGKLSIQDREAAVDRLVLGLERCHETDIGRIGYQDLASGHSSEISVQQLSDILKAKLVPKLVSLDTDSLTRLVYAKVSHRQASDAMRMVNGGLAIVPGNEKLLLVRAILHIDEYHYDKALADLESAIASLEAKLASNEILIKDADGNIVPSFAAKHSFWDILHEAYLFRGWIHLEKGQPQEAIKDARLILSRDENNLRAMKLAIKGYEAIGDTDNTTKLTHKLTSVQTEELVHQILGVR